MRTASTLLLSEILILGCLTGCRATPPGNLETTVINWVKRHITVKGTHQLNPIKDTAENVANGRHIFGFYCVVCPGRDGQNTGVPFADGMSPPIPSLASAEIQRYSDGELKWIIENGISPSGMPASRGTLSDDEMWNIVIYLRHLPAKGSLGEPNAYSGEEFPDEHENNK
jgi:mono/diheme cytochrome c family protein